MTESSPSDRDEVNNLCLDGCKTLVGILPLLVCIRLLLSAKNKINTMFKEEKNTINSRKNIRKHKIEFKFSLPPFYFR